MAFMPINRDSTLLLTLHSLVCSSFSNGECEMSQQLAFPGRFVSDKRIIVNDFDYINLKTRDHFLRAAAQVVARLYTLASEYVDIR